jgi:hypothetical protein
MKAVKKSGSTKCWVSPKKTPLQEAATRARQLMLEPNRDSDLKVERYGFGLSKEIVLGEPCEFSMQNSPDVNFRIQEATANAYCPGMFFIRDIRVANVCCIIGGGIDAYAVKKWVIDFPTLTPANRVTALVQYTGLVPDELKSMPAPKMTMESLVHAMKEAMHAHDTTEVNGILKRALDCLPMFEFSLTLSGPARIC